jgi:hypothetical protein
MKPRFGRTLLFMFICLPIPLVAGEIFGSITEGEKPVPEGVKIEIAIAGSSAYEGTTDKFGAYRIFAKEKGKGQITVHYKNQSPSTELFSYDKSLRYDWVLEAQDGKYTLRRK